MGQAKERYEAALDREREAYRRLPNGERRYERVEAHRRPDGSFCCEGDARRYGYEPV